MRLTKRLDAIFARLDELDQKLSALEEEELAHCQALSAIETTLIDRGYLEPISDPEAVTEGSDQTEASS